jgi:hypothetical protein
MNSNILTYKVKLGESVVDSIKNAIQLAKDKDQQVGFKHNDIELEVDKFDNSYDVYVNWYLKAHKVKC